MRVLITTIILAALPPMGIAQKWKFSIGQVRNISGSPEILRHPVKKLTPKAKQKASDRGYVFAYHQGKYWESIDIKAGSKLYYGDQITTSSDSGAEIELKDGFIISIAPLSTIRLSRTFMDLKKQTRVQRWLSVISGTIRALATEPRRPRKTKFRTRSMAMGVRGTDFVIENNGGQSKLITLSGEVSVRPITAREQKIFEQVTNPTRTIPLKMFAKQQRQLIVLAQAQKSVPVTAGMRVQVSTPKASTVETSMALQSAAAEPPPVIKVSAVTSDDIAKLSEQQKSLEFKTKDSANKALPELV